MRRNWCHSCDQREVLMSVTNPGETMTRWSKKKNKTKQVLRRRKRSGYIPVQEYKYPPYQHIQVATKTTQTAHAVEFPVFWGTVALANMLAHRLCFHWPEGVEVMRNFSLTSTMESLMENTLCGPGDSFALWLFSIVCVCVYVIFDDAAVTGGVDPQS